MSDIQQPVDPQSSPTYRAAKYAVIVLSALIILALIGLVAGVVMRMAGYSTHFGSGSLSSAQFTLPPGARIVHTETQPGRLILLVNTPDGDEVDIVSTEDGRLVSSIKSAPPSMPVR